LIPANVSGRVVSSYDGQVLENFHARDMLIYHDNVTVRNFRITRSNRDSWFAIAIMDHADTGRDVVGTSFEDGQIITRNPATGEPWPSGGIGINGSFFTARRLDISYMEDGVSGREFVVEDCYIHDLVRFGGAHNDGISSGSGKNYVVRHNSIVLGDQTGAVMMGTNKGTIDTVLIENNFLNGGSYTIYSRDNGHGPPTNVTVRGNAFGRDYNHGILSKEPDGKVTWENNTWADTGEYIDTSGHVIGPPPSSTTTTTTTVPATTTTSTTVPATTTTSTTVPATTTTSTTVPATTTTSTTVPPKAQGSVVRLWGSDRYGTAAAVSRDAFAAADVVYVATGVDFPDALVGAAAAGSVDGPVLLVGRTSLPGATRAELARLSPRRIVVVGGPSVVDDAVVRRLEGLVGG
jgi:hypothetical protein